MKTLKFPADGKTMKKALKHKWTEARDDAYDRAHGIKEGSKRDITLDHSRGLAKKRKMVRKPSTIYKRKHKMSGPIKHTGKFNGKSNVLGQGGRAAQMRARGVPGGVIGAIARREGAAPGGPNYHKRKK